MTSNVYYIVPRAAKPSRFYLSEKALFRDIDTTVFSDFDRISDDTNLLYKCVYEDSTHYKIDFFILSALVIGDLSKIKNSKLWYLVKPSHYPYEVHVSYESAFGELEGMKNNNASLELSSEGCEHPVYAILFELGWKHTGYNLMVADLVLN